MEEGHKLFSVSFFNHAWDLIEKGGRSPAEEREMVASAMASYLHWSLRPDCTDQEKSIGAWQVSRVFALIGEGNLARKWAEASVQYGQHLEPFFVGYALEASARASLILGDSEAAREALANAQTLLPLITDPEDRDALAKDLASLALP